MSAPHKGHCLLDEEGIAHMLPAYGCGCYCRFMRVVVMAVAVSICLGELLLESYTSLVYLAAGF